MPREQVLFFEAWSLSRLTEWEKCPFKAAKKHLYKIAEPSNPAGSRGTGMHKDAEQFTNGHVKKLPPLLVNYTEEFEDLVKNKKRKLRTELQVGLDKDWKPTSWYNEPGKNPPWVRVVMDLTYDESVLGARKKAVGLRRSIIDYKSGKFRAENQEGLEVYAIAGFQMAPTPTEVYTALWYLDAGKTDDKSYVIGDLPKLKKKWEVRASRMLADRVFLPKPGNQCGFCHLSKAKGGPCPY